MFPVLFFLWAPFSGVDATERRTEVFSAGQWEEVGGGGGEEEEVGGG